MLVVVGSCGCKSVMQRMAEALFLFVVQLALNRHRVEGEGEEGFVLRFMDTVWYYV